MGGKPPGGHADCRSGASDRYGGGETGIDATAAALVEGKMGATYLGLFVLGILCNICIFIAVNGYANNPHQVGKYLALFLGVSVFILCGTEHSVADMYYWSVSGVLYAQPGSRFSAF
ncbi:MAG: formate/nitrite transporter family protein [Evtepia gabavorous]